MRKTKNLAIVIECLFLVACVATQPPMQDQPSLTESSALQTRVPTLRLEVPADADVKDIPWLMAVESLREKGYSVETMSFSGDALTVTALTEGDLDLASASNRMAWTAIDKGASIFTFLDLSANTSLLIAGTEIQTCADLAGKSVAVIGAGTVSGGMLEAYLTEKCPGVEPTTVIMAGGSNRRAALLTGAVDAALQDVDDWIRIERDKPGQFYPLIFLGREFPGLQTTSYVARRGFAERYPKVVEEMIQATLTARRDLQDAEALREAIIEHLDLEVSEAQEMAEAYLAIDAWDTGGGLTLETMQATVVFLQTYCDLPANLKTEDVVDLSYYEAAIDQIEGG